MDTFKSPNLGGLSPSRGVPNSTITGHLSSAPGMVLVNFEKVSESTFFRLDHLEGIVDEANSLSIINRDIL